MWSKMSRFTFSFVHKTLIKYLRSCLYDNGSVCLFFYQSCVRCICDVVVLFVMLLCWFVWLSASEEHLSGGSGSGSCRHSLLHSAVCEWGRAPPGGLVRPPSACWCCCLPLQCQDRRAGDCGRGAGQRNRESKYKPQNIYFHIYTTYHPLTKPYPAGEGSVWWCCEFGSAGVSVGRERRESWCVQTECRVSVGGSERCRHHHLRHRARCAGRPLAALLSAGCTQPPIHTSRYYSSSDTLY